VAGVRHPDMRGVAREESTAVAKAACDQPAPVTVLFGDDVVFEIGADAEDGPNTGVAIDFLEVDLARAHIIVDQPSFASVDGVDHPGTARVDNAGAPGALAVLAANEVGRADIGRLHALHDRVSDKLGANRLADDGSRAVATDEITVACPPGRACFEVPHNDTYRIVVNADVFDERAVDDVDARLCRGMLEQDGLEKNLVDAMRRLRRRPVAIRTVLARETVAAAGNGNARQFAPRERGAVSDVVRIIRRQSSVADLLRQPEPPEDFHASRRDMVAFRLGRFCRTSLLDHRDARSPTPHIRPQSKTQQPG